MRRGLFLLAGDRDPVEIDVETSSAVNYANGCCSLHSG